MRQDIHDVLIIGAGPCGLAVAARLCERTPSALFTDDEHRRYHWIRRHSGRMAVLNYKNGHVSAARQTHQRQYSIQVLDSSADQWMARWNRLFKLFDIQHLRSPMFFHTDPRDRDALLAFMYEEGRQHECCEIGGCVGKEKSKHRKKKDRKFASRPREPTVDERERKDYYTPSRELFADQCAAIIQHYRLRDGLINQETVEDIDYAAFEDEQGERLFAVRTNKGTHKARTVVLAVGPGNGPVIPGSASPRPIPGACHAMQIQEFPDPALKTKVKQRRATHIMVVGGGLTSAQITDLAIRRGVTKVWHVMRSQVKVKPFDITLEWLGKFRNAEQASFWSADSDEERLAQMLAARNGGSITPTFHKVLKSHQASGKLEIFTETIIKSKVWDADKGTWTVQTEPSIDLPPLDYIYYATGIQTDVNTIPYLQTIHQKYPIKSQGGLPCINDDLMWADEVPLFVTGRLGALRLGPGGPNLAGARSGAERIAWSIDSLLETDDGALQETDSYYRLGVGSQYAALNLVPVESQSDSEG